MLAEVVPQIPLKSVVRSAKAYYQSHQVTFTKLMHKDWIPKWFIVLLIRKKY